MFYMCPRRENTMTLKCGVTNVQPHGSLKTETMLLSLSLWRLETVIAPQSIFCDAALFNYAHKSGERTAGKQIRGSQKGITRSSIERLLFYEHCKQHFFLFECYLQVSQPAPHQYKQQLLYRHPLCRVVCVLLVRREAENFNSLCFGKFSCSSFCAQLNKRSLGL